MDAEKPAELGKLFVSLFAIGDLPGLVALFETDAIMPTSYGTATGTDEIRDAIKRYIDSGAKLSFARAISFESGAVALIQNEWTMRLAGGQELSGVTADVARRQADGTWKYLINSPDGAALLTG